MNGKIPAAEPIIEEEEKRAVQEVLESGHIASGPMVDEFEERFADYIGVEEAVAVSSGTAALITSLESAGMGKGDEVILPSYSFFSTASSVIKTGADPVFVDIDPETYCMNTDDIEGIITDDTEAILPVHLYGHPADMEQIDKIAEENDLIVIEDSCQAHGAEFDGTKTGAFGDFGCFSFYATKNITTAEGGMITTDRKDMAEKARLIREHGREDRCYHKLIGYNFLMNDLEAALGVEQLKRLDGFNEQRRKNASILDEELAPVEKNGIVKRPKEKEKARHVYHQYPLRIQESDRERVLSSMQKAGIGVRNGYGKPLPKQDAIEEILDDEVYCPETEKACEEVIWIPVHPKLDASHMRRISYGLKQFL